MILIIYAHPYPHHSHANKRMLEQARTLDGVEIRSLYQLYPDFNIDVAAEQAALARRADYLAASDAVVQRAAANETVDG
jgi:glutathione-regulated potassium-efflux system ancillary protein KefF